MKVIATVLIGVAALISGCADFPTDHDGEQKKAHEPVDRNRNSVPDSLERKAVPMEPVLDRPLKTPD